MSNKRMPSLHQWRADMRNDRAERPNIREERLSPVRDPKAPGGKAYPLSAWRGLSGARYVFRADRLEAETLAHSESCVALAISRSSNGAAIIIDIRTDIHLDEVEGWIGRMQDAGATELHRCVSGRDGSLSARERMAIALDLTNETPALAQAA